MRKLVSGPGHFALQDVSPAGDILVAHGMSRPAIVARGPGATEDIELGWLDYSILADMSDDGRRILFAEQAVGGGPGYAVYVRNTDGTPAVRLGKGDGHSLSHDGRWALAHDLTRIRCSLLPTGAGQPRNIPEPRHRLPIRGPAFYRATSASCLPAPTRRASTGCMCRASMAELLDP